MTDTLIKLRRSAVPGKIPSDAQLQLGEVAINTFDGKMFFKRSAASNTIIEVATTTNGLNQFASTTSSQLASVITDETGTGLLVFNTTPALTSPVISGNTNFDSGTLFVDAVNNRVGIGTTSPASILTVARSTADVYSGTTLAASNTGTSIFIDNVNDTIGSFGQIVFRNGATGQIFNRIVSVRDASGQGSLAFVTGNSSAASERFRINSSGNIGIATTSPSATLDVAGDIEVNSNVNLNSESTTLATTTKTQIASFAAASFRSAKLIVQAYDSVTGEVQITELLVAHNGTTASATEYGVVFTGSNPLVVYDVDISSGNVRILAQRTTTNLTHYTVFKTTLINTAVAEFSWDSNTTSPGPAI